MNAINGVYLIYSKSKLFSFKIAILKRYLDSIQYDSFKVLANSNIEMENIGNENSENNKVKNIFENVKVDDKLMCSNSIEVFYYSSSLFEV
ncbi:hypothetical protein GLOIN_2v1771923 [Rhizophagus irregularis DAOM 181602=DAOM 197198]|nr:hypothetical protein GLOIN_2v1771923 [Rhizophagus irregularis DAOM 181602=DAOM 197198]